MENIQIVVVAAIVAAIVYFFYRRGKLAAAQSKVADLSCAKVETVEGVLRLEDVVSIFKAQNLNRATHTPFIAGSLSGFEVKPEGFLSKDGYVPLVMGVYNAGRENVQFMEVVFARSFDGKLQQALTRATNDNPLVVLG